MSNCRLIQLALELEKRIYIYIYRNQGPQFKRTRSCKVKPRKFTNTNKKRGNKIDVFKKNYFQEIYAKKLLALET